METTFEKISRKTGRKFVECKCDQCKMQCRICPCLGTPEDINKIIDAGHKDKLAMTEWGAGIMMGMIDFTVPMVQPNSNQNGCVFLDNGLCSLHTSGLKPTEGKLSHHSTRTDNFNTKRSISWNVALEWMDEKNLPTIVTVFEKMLDRKLSL